MARKPFKKIKRNPPPNSKFNWDMLDVYRHKNQVLLEAREKVKSGEMTPDQARAWLQDEVERDTGHRPEVNKGKATAEERARFAEEIRLGKENKEKERLRLELEAAAEIESEKARKQKLKEGLAEKGKRGEKVPLDQLIEAGFYRTGRE